MIKDRLYRVGRDTQTGEVITQLKSRREMAASPGQRSEGGVRPARSVSSQKRHCALYLTGAPKGTDSY